MNENMKKRMKIIIIAAVCLILLLAAGFIMIMFFKNNSEEELAERERIGERSVAEDELASGYLTTGDGLVVYDDNEYYQVLIRILERMVEAPEEPCDDPEWHAWWMLRHSGGNTNITVYINKDIREVYGTYQDEEDFLNHCSFRISGTLRGESVSRCIAYGTELKDLQAALENAKDFELLKQSEKEANGETEGFEAYYQMELAPGLVFLTTDDQGHIVMLTDSDLTELNALSGCNRRVRVYEFRPATEEETEGLNPKPQIVGKLEFLETF